MKTTFLFLFLLQTTLCLATHNMGGEITYRHLNGYTYEIKITTYTRTSSVQADRPSLDSVYPGDGPPVVFSRILKENLPNDISRNTYVQNHTYPQQGLYKIYFTDPNWDAGIINIPNSVNTPFCTESMLVVFDPAYCPNNSTQFLNDPVFIVQQTGDHHQCTAVYEPDADSVSFELIPCLISRDSVIPGYTFPQDLTIDSISGEISWPVSGQFNIGAYGVTVRINQWRRGYLVGYINRVFQLILNQSADTLHQLINTFPFPTDIAGHFVDTIPVGDTLRIALYYTDPVDSLFDLNYFGEVFLGTPQLISITNNNLIYDSLIWIPEIADARTAPYVFSFRGISGLHNIQNDLTYTVYVPGVRADTCPAFPYIGIDEIVLSNPQVAIFPHPLHDQSMLRFKCNDPIQCPNELIIFDMTGRIFYSSIIHNEGLLLNRKDFVPGIYLVGWANGKNSGIAGKFIVQ